MRVFLYEFLCSELPGDQTGTKSLRAEGWAMRSALAEDFARVPGVEVLTPQTPDRTAFQSAVQMADFSLVIAPEFDNLLETRCRWVDEAGGRLLGSSPTAVRLAGDKLALAQYLTRRGVPTPECWQWSPDRPAPSCRFPLVYKPRQGAGSQATFLVPAADRLAGCAAQAEAEGWPGEAIVQPFVTGQPASVAFLIGPRQTVPLVPATQRLSADGRLRYLGGQLPLPDRLRPRAVRLAHAAVAAVPGLAGYVGVDVVLGLADDGSQDWVIEINPRLTTSYVGLRALAQDNLAESMLRIVQGHAIASLGWRPGRVAFQADGTVEELSDEGIPT
jgi:tyramine---L-glutamate ligase